MITPEREQDLRDAAAIKGISTMEGWRVLMKVIEEIRKESYNKWRETKINQVVDKKSFIWKELCALSEEQAFKELLVRLEDLRSLR